MATVAAGRRSARVRFRLRRSHRGTLLALALAHLRGPWLDRELAAGVEPWRTAMHSARSLQITGTRGRRGLAHSLEQLVERARTPSRVMLLSARVPIDHLAVLGACPHLTAIAERLRDGRPVSTAGVAALRDLITDGAGPIYSPLSGESLGRVLVSIRDSLDVPD